LLTFSKQYRFQTYFNFPFLRRCVHILRHIAQNCSLLFIEPISGIICIRRNARNKTASPVSGPPPKKAIAGTTDRIS
jgi:hypothetical protein